MAEASLFHPSGEASLGSKVWKREGSSPSFQQMLALALAAKHHNRSFLGSVLHGGGHGLEWAMRQILRPSVGVAEGTRRALEGKGFDAGDFAKGFSRGVQLKRHTTFSDVLKQEFPKWSREHKTLRAVAGFGLDVVTDPTLPLQIGAVIATGGAAAPEIVAGRALLETASKVGVESSARLAAARESAQIFKKLGPEFNAHKAVASWKAIAAKRAMRASKGEWKGPLLNEAEQAKFSISSELAKQEFAKTGPKVLQASYKIPFSGKRFNITPAKIGGQRVAPKALTLERAAAGEGIVGKVPLVKQSAHLIGHTFRHGFGEEEWQKPLLMMSHFGDHLFSQMTRHGAATIGRALKDHNIKDPHEMWHALTWAESRQNLIHGADRKMDEAVLASGVEKRQITPGQADFIKEWHNHFEMLRRRDKMFKVPYKKDIPQNKIYIPHIYDQHGMPLRNSHIAIPGFSKKRVGNLTAAEMHRIHTAKEGSEGWLKSFEKSVPAGERLPAKEANLVTNPMELAGIRTRRGAQAHATETLLQTMRLAGGMPHRIYDAAKMAKWEKGLKDAEARMRKHEWLFSKTGPANEANKMYKGVKAEYKRRVNNANLKYRAMRSGVPFHEHLKTGDINIHTGKDRIRPIPGYKTHKAREIGKSVAEHPKFLRAHIRALDRQDKWLADQSGRVHDILQERKATALREIGHGWKDHNRFAKLIERGAFKKNPDIPGHFEKLNRKIEGEYYHYPPEIHAAMSKVSAAVRSDEELAKLATNLHKAMAKWKIGVTSINPGYRIRNSLSDMWNAYISGVPAWGMVKYGNRAAIMYHRALGVQQKLVEAERTHVMPTLSHKEQVALQHFADATMHGTMSGLFQGDVNLVAQILAKGGTSGFRRAKTMAKEGHLVASYARYMQEFNMHAENWGRFTHYLYRRESERLTPEASADWVKKAHFDYTELTPVEREKFRAYIPFYTWSRKNIPYQLVQMFAHPGRFATFPKFVRSSSEAAGGDTNESMMPGWLRQKWAFQVPFFGKQTYMTPMIGVGDLARLEGNPLSEILSMAGPHVKMPFEIATGKSTFTGQDINQGRREPIGGLAAAILKHIPGTDVGKTARSPHGQRVEGKGASPWVNYLLGQLPLTQTLLHVGDPITKAKRGSAGALGYRDLAYLTGLPLYKRDPETEATVAELQNADELKKAIKRLRDEGIIPPSKRGKKSAFQKRLDKMLAGK